MKKIIAILFVALFCAAEIGCADKSGNTHTHMYSWSVKTSATCEHEGLRHGVCSCGDEKTEIIPRAEHSYGEWITVLDSTCKTEGSKERTCSVCLHVETQTISFDEHRYCAFIKELDRHYKQCDICGDITEEGKHVMKGDVCEVCGYNAAPAVLTYELIHDDEYPDEDYYVVKGVEVSAPNVVIPDTYNGVIVYEIADSAFSGNNDIVSVTIGNNVEFIGQQAFLKCENLTEIKLGESVYKIGDYAFQSTPITSIEFPASLKTIGKAAFSKTEKLGSVTVPSTVTNIGQYAFWASGVKSVKLDGRYGSDMFYGCTQLTSAVIGKNALNNVWWSFNSCTSLVEYQAEEGGRYAATDGVLYSSDMTVCHRAPRGMSGEMRVADGVTRLNTEAFMNCDKITGVVMPYTLQTVGDGAGTASTFNGSGVVELEFPDACVSIGNYTCCNCALLKTVRFGKNIENLNAHMFKGCTSLESVTVDSANENFETHGKSIVKTSSAGVKTLVISDGNIPAGVTDIGDCAFVLDVDATSISLPSGVKYIGRNAFIGMKKLAAVSLPSTLRSIDAYAFGECEALSAIVIPASVNQISPWAFEKCTALASVTFEKKTGWKIRKNGASSSSDVEISVNDSSVTATDLVNDYCNCFWLNA